MSPRPQRVRRLAALLGAALLGPLAAAAPAAARAADLPPQEPGVTLRTYDTRVPLTTICTLKPGQTPNVDKLMPVVDWTSAADFGFEDNFLTHALANINIAVAGAYTFRLTSDDGSRLYIDDTLVDRPRRAARRHVQGRHGHADRGLPRAAGRDVRGRRRPAAHAGLAAAGCRRLRRRPELTCSAPTPAWCG